MYEMSKCSDTKPFLLNMGYASPSQLIQENTSQNLQYVSGHGKNTTNSDGTCATLNPITITMSVSKMLLCTIKLLNKFNTIRFTTYTNSYMQIMTHHSFSSLWQCYLSNIHNQYQNHDLELCKQITIPHCHACKPLSCNSM